MRHDHWLALSCCLAAAFAAGAGTAATTAGDDHVARMEHQHTGEAPTASPATVPEPTAPVATEEVVYATFDGVAVRGYLARPQGATAPLPGLLVIHEWWGLNDNVRAMTRRFAGEGYVALAVDLYEGRIANDAASAKGLMTESLGRKERLVDHLRQARGLLATRARPATIGVVGWCFGGGWTLEAALSLGGDLQAAVMYYGRVQTDPKALANLKAPLLGLFGGRDQGIPLDGVREMERTLQALGRDATIVVYPEADHAFANPSGARYDAAAAADAWEKTLAFFARHLKR